MTTQAPRTASNFTQTRSPGEKKQAEEATKYREFSEKIKSSEAALYYLKIQNIEKEKSQLKDESTGINTQINT